MLSKHTRITPAYAGTTYRRCDRPDLQRDHPPLTRELHIILTQEFKHLGITPAYAGTTGIAVISPEFMTDHPRLRGNYSSGCLTSSSISGSPPLTRELLNQVCSNFRRYGITPAYAGTTPSCRSVEIPSRDHPRLRGNYHKLTHLRDYSVGSPPLTRELRVSSLFAFASSGITPAYAGTTHETIAEAVAD